MSKFDSKFVFLAATLLLNANCGDSQTPIEFDGSALPDGSDADSDAAEADGADTIEDVDDTGDTDELPDSQDDTPDAPDSPDVTDVDPPENNACGGVEQLTFGGAPAELGSACGCAGTLTCAGQNALVCSGEVPANACGGCGALAYDLGGSCGTCDDGRVECRDGAAICVGPSETNVCGGCSILSSAIGGPCSIDDVSGLYRCDGSDAVVCETGTTVNACGSEGALEFQGVPSLPGAPCDLGCGVGRLVCADGELECTAETPNACGSCGALAGTPTTACGCDGAGIWTCDAETGAVACLGGAPNSCGGCAALGNVPGSVCDGGVFVCASSDAVVCDTTPGSGNLCGGSSTLASAPGSVCGSCDTGVWNCDGADALQCSGDLGVAAFNDCGSCGVLPGEVGGACGTCGSGNWGCGEGILFCFEDAGEAALNECGGCAVLPASPGQSCGECATWRCEGGGLLCGVDPTLPGCEQLEVTCDELDCTTLNRDCDELAVGENAACADCLLGFVERGGVCVPAECDASDDCPAIVGEWGACGWADVCAQTANQSRTVQARTCEAGACVSNGESLETAACEPRVTDGTNCGAGAQCLGGSCVDVEQTCADLNCADQNRQCSERAAGEDATCTSCLSGYATVDGRCVLAECFSVADCEPAVGAWGACDWADVCDRNSVRTRSVTARDCVNFSCVDLAPTDETENCPQRATDGVSCAPNSECDDEVCVPLFIETTCPSLNCGAQFRSCDERALGEDAVCTDCLAGFVDAGTCVPEIVCADLICEDQFRQCDENSPNEDATCGGCLDLYGEIAGACVFIECLDDSACPGSESDWSACEYTDACDESAVRSRNVTQNQCVDYQCEFLATSEEVETCGVRATEGEICGQDSVCVDEQCTLAPECEIFGCSAQNRECVVSEFGSSCGACLDGFEDVGGICVPTVCLLISEYVEGSGFTKAIEIWNCGNTEISLADYRVCQANNAEGTGTTYCPTAFRNRALDTEGFLAPGDVFTICNSQWNSVGMPTCSDAIAAGLCDVCESSVTSFSGDDRLAVYRDDNANGLLDSADRIFDAFGILPRQLNYYGEATYRRRTCEARDGLTDDSFISPWPSFSDFMSQFPQNTVDNLGVAPPPCDALLGTAEFCAPDGFNDSCSSGWCSAGRCATAGFSYVLPWSATFGSPSYEIGRDGDEDLHLASIIRPFEIQANEVSHDDWFNVTGSRPAAFATCGDLCPVENISWFAAAAYANERSRSAGVAECYRLLPETCADEIADWADGSPSCESAEFLGPDCAGFRLPTEAEWEFAYRAGSTLSLYSGNLESPSGPSSQFDAIGWYVENSAGTPHPGGLKAANANQIRDLAGNVAEWVSDVYAPYSRLFADPSGPRSGANRVVRGGSWADEASAGRAANRDSVPPSARSSQIGFRLARTYFPTACDELTCETVNRVCGVSDNLASCGPCVDSNVEQNGNCGADSTGDAATGACTEAGPSLTCASGWCGGGLCSDDGLVRAAGGVILMGSSMLELGRSSDEIQHTIRVSRGLEAAPTEVTQAEWLSVAGVNPSSFVACGESCPVTDVNFYASLAFANAKSTLAGLPECYTFAPEGCELGWQDGAVNCSSAAYSGPTCAGYRLPTEAEWEYLYRARTDTALYAGNLSSASGADPVAESVAWYAANADSTVHPVGTKSPNLFGLYDVAGNAAEWVWDWYATYGDVLDDPISDATCCERVVRGGSYLSQPAEVRAAARAAAAPQMRSPSIGFRLVRTAQLPIGAECSQYGEATECETGWCTGSVCAAAAPYRWSFSTTQGWSSSAIFGEDAWVWDSTRGHWETGRDSSGTFVNYPANSESVLTSPLIDNTMNAWDLSISFSYYGGIESADGLYVEYSTDGGAFWQDASARLGGASSAPFAIPQSSFRPTYVMGSTSGRTLQVRFRLQSGSSIIGTGPTIDDVRIFPAFSTDPFVVASENFSTSTGNWRGLQSSIADEILVSPKPSDIPELFDSGAISASVTSWLRDPLNQYIELGAGTSAYVGNESSAIESASFDFSDSAEPTISFDLAGSAEEGRDILYVMFSIDAGASWNFANISPWQSFEPLRNVGKFSATGLGWGNGSGFWGVKSVVVPGAARQSDVKFRLYMRANGSNNDSPGPMIDNIVLLR